MPVCMLLVTAYVLLSAGASLYKPKWQPAKTLDLIALVHNLMARIHSGHTRAEYGPLREINAYFLI